MVVMKLAYEHLKGWLASRSKVWHLTVWTLLLTLCGAMGYYLGNQAIEWFFSETRQLEQWILRMHAQKEDWDPYPFSGDRRELIGVALPSTGDLKELPPDADRRDLIITLQRTSCYGTCPAYKLITHENGRVTYDGIAHVRVRGKREGRIGQEKIRQLLKLLKEKEYLSLKDDYVDYDETDDPSVITSISVDGKRKRVRHYYGDTASPRRLYEIEAGIDAIVDSAQWVSGVLKRAFPT